MRDSDYYPAGAYNDPNAPYNECEAPEIELGVTVHETLTRDHTIVTNDAWYVHECEEGITTTYLEDSNLDARKEYEDQNNLLAVNICKAKEEITKLREEAERQQIKLEQHYGVRHRTIPGWCGTPTEFEKRRRSQLSEAMDRIRELKALEEALSGWEHEDIDVEVDK